MDSDFKRNQLTSTQSVEKRSKSKKKQGESLYNHYINQYSKTHSNQAKEKLTKPPNLNVIQNYYAYEKNNENSDENTKKTADLNEKQEEGNK